MSQHATHPAASKGNNNARSAKDDAMSTQTGNCSAFGACTPTMARATSCMASTWP